MVIEAFPKVEDADYDGLLAIGGDLEIASLLLAYRSGIFPWPVEGVLAWFAPRERALLFFEELHLPRSLRHLLKKHNWRCSFNTAFEKVITNCATMLNRGEQTGTWITDEMIAAYVSLHKAGYAHSAEVWRGEKLVGGVYGVATGGAFAGESMFYREPNASKVALVFLIEHLRQQGGEWLDCQVLTPLLETLGARLVKRGEFMRLLNTALLKRNYSF